jgi:hypothetical protein
MAVHRRRPCEALAPERAAQPRPQGGVPILEHVPLGNVVVAEVVDLGEQVGAADLGGNALVGLVRLKVIGKGGRARVCVLSLIFRVRVRSFSLGSPGRTRWVIPPVVFQ